MTYRNDTPLPEWYEPDEVEEDFWPGESVWWVVEAVDRAEILSKEPGNPYWQYISRLTTSMRNAIADRVGRVDNEWFMETEILNHSRDKEEFQNDDEQDRFKEDVVRVVWFIVADTEDSDGYSIMPDSVVEELAEWVVGMREGA